MFEHNKCIDMGAGMMMELIVDGKPTLRPVTVTMLHGVPTYEPEVRDNEALVSYVGGRMEIVRTRN